MGSDRVLCRSRVVDSHSLVAALFVWIVATFRQADWTDMITRWAAANPSIS